MLDLQRIGLLGVCDGGCHAVSAATTDPRFRAVATVVASDIAAAMRHIRGPESARETLAAVARERSAEAERQPPRRDPRIPDSLAKAKEAGITNPESLAAVWFYRASEFRHPTATKRILFRSFGPVLDFDAFGMVTRC